MYNDEDDDDENTGGCPLCGGEIMSTTYADSCTECTWGFLYPSVYPKSGT